MRPGRTEFRAAGYRFSCCGTEGGEARAGQRGVGSAVKESTINKVTWTQGLISERLMLMT